MYFSRYFPILPRPSYIENVAYYIIINSWAKDCLVFSQQFGYWSFTHNHAVVLNYLLHVSLLFFFFLYIYLCVCCILTSDLIAFTQVNLLSTLKKSGCFQGYAMMKSEVIDLHTSKFPQYVIGTPFQCIGEYHAAKFGSRVWRYICRIEWKSR